MAKHFFTRPVFSLATAAVSLVFSPLGAQQTVVQGSRFQSSHSVAQIVAAPADLAGKLAGGQRSAISLSGGDFFEDGAKGLVTGYAFGNGGVVAAQKGTLPNGAAGSTASPFSETAHFTDVGMRPDFLQAADLNGDGQQDLIVATRGGSSIATLLGNGKGGFTLQPVIAVSGSISALAVWKIPGTGEPLIALGLAGASPSLSLYKADGTLVASVALSAAPTILEIARLNGGAADDIVAGGPSGLSVIDGSTLQSASPRIDRLPVAGAVAAATGSFVYDRRYLPQIAVLTQDGSVHTLARTGVISTPPTAADFHVGVGGKGKSKSTVVPISPWSLSWTDAETLSGVAVPTSGSTPLLLRGRISGSGGDDLVALNVNGGGIATIAHPVAGYSEGENAGKVQILPARVETESAPAGAVQSAVAMRVGQSAAMGLVTASNAAQPEVAEQTAYHTYYVNTTADATSGSPTNASNCVSGATSNTSCRLRDAFAAANADHTYNEAHSSADTINVAAGTYTLSYNTGPDGQGSATYHIEIYGPINLIGTAGAPTTIISAANKDKIFSGNSGFNMPTIPLTNFDFYMSGLTLENGKNLNVYSDNFPVINENGGLFDFETNGGGNLTIVNSVLTAGISPSSGGGALFLSDNIYGNNAGPGNGTLEVDNTTISSNQSSEVGGGISVIANGNGDVPVILGSGDIITGNQASHAVNTNDNSDVEPGSGGGVYLGLNSAATERESTVTSTTFSSNTGVQQSGQNAASGGGLYSGNGISISNSTFTGNSINNSASGGAGGGGGLFVSSYYYASVVEGSTFAPVTTGLTPTGGNMVSGSGSDGGAVLISTDSASPDAPKGTTFSYNRVTGNVAPTHTGLALQGPAGTNETVTATDDFWGCNGPGSGTGCDTAGISSGGGTLTLSPYAEVTATLNTATPAPGTQLSLTGALNMDSTPASLAGNVFAFEGLTATLTIAETFAGAMTATTLATSTETTSSTAGTPTALTATPTASGSGAGTVKIDNATGSAPFTVTVASPTISIAFSPTSIPLNGTSTLTYTLTNPNTDVPLNGVAFSDTLPSGLQISATPGVSSTCSGTFTATAGSSSASLSGGTINSGSNCTISVSVTGTTAGTKNNTTGAVTATNETASGTTSNTATLTVLAPVTLTTAFGAATIPLNGSTTLTFTLTNPDSASQSGITFNDQLPSGMTGSLTSNSCSGTVTTLGPSSFEFDSGTLAAGASCNFVYTVTGTTAGNKTNVTSAPSSTQGGTGTASTASITVVAPATISAAFASSQIDVGSSTVLTLTLTNSSTVVQTGVALTPGALPAGLVISTPNGISNTCGGTATAAAGSSSYSLSGGSIPASGSCALSFSVTSSAIGGETTTTGTVSSTTGGTGNSTSATVNVVAVPTLTLTGPATVNRGAAGSTVTATYTVTSGSLAPTAQFSLYDGSTLLSSVTATQTSSTTYTATFSTATIPSDSQTVTAQYPGDANYPQVTSNPLTIYVIANNIWIGNPGGTTSALQYNGTALSGSPFTGGGVAVAIDSLGNVWSLNASHSTVARFSNTGAVVSSGYSGGGLSGAYSLAIDGVGQVWISNQNNSVSEFAHSGTAISPSTGYTGGNLNNPTSISIDISGNLWIANQGNNSVTEVLGAAAPVVPLAIGVANNTTGSKP